MLFRSDPKIESGIGNFGSFAVSVKTPLWSVFVPMFRQSLKRIESEKPAFWPRIDSAPFGHARSIGDAKFKKINGRVIQKGMDVTVHILPRGEYGADGRPDGFAPFC